MPRRLRKNLKREPLPAFLAGYLTSGQWPALTDDNRHDVIPVMYFKPPDYIERAWYELRQRILDSFITEHPGRRPWAWWEFDAPRAPMGVFRGWLDGRLPEPRLRLGGAGTASHEALAYFPHFSFGLPVSWVGQWSVDLYNGRTLDVHGNPDPLTRRDGTPYCEGDFPYLALDPNDPPTFESQAAHLQRHGLLSAAEARHANFTPEPITFSEDATDAD